MEILDQEEQPSNSKKEHFYNYLFSSWIAIMGPALLINLGFINAPFFLEGRIDVIVWLILLMSLVLFFYKKIMRKNWYLPMTFLALFISYLATVLVLDTLFNDAPKASLITGFFIYLSHAGTVLALAAIYYYNNHKLN